MILLFDSSAMTVRLVLVTDTGEPIAYEWEAGRTLARDMLQFITDKLQQNGGTLDSIKGIGVFRGPGSYTGLRIGLTVLNTLAGSLNVPIVGAVGKDWEAACLERLSQHKNDSIVLPEYGGDAHITTPKK